MKWSVLGLVFVGVVAAGSAAILVGAVRSGGISSLKSEEAPSEIQVVVASESLPAMTVIEAGSVVTKKLSSTDAPEEYVSSPVQLIGKVLIVPMMEGQPFAHSCFASKSSGMQLAAALEDGMRAVSVSLTDYSGLYGLLYPGSVVDVLASFKTRSTVGNRNDALSVTILKGVQVLGVEDQTVVSAEKGEDPEGLKGSRQRNKRWMVTVMVTTHQAQALQLAMEHGKISLAMRNPLDMTVAVDRGPTSLGKLTTSGLGELSKSFGRLAEMFGGKRTAERRSVKTPAPGAWNMEILRAGVPDKVSFPLSQVKVEENDTNNNARKRSAQP